MSSKPALRSVCIAAAGLLAASCNQLQIKSPKTDINISPAPYFDNKTGIYFPGSLGGMRRQPTVYLENRSPGLGVAISYRDRDSKLDVFVYDLQASVIPIGVDSPVIQRSFQDAIADIDRAAQRRLYSDLTLHETETITLGGQPYLHAHVSYRENDLQKDGHLLLSGINGQIVKIRSSVVRSSEFNLWRALGYLARAIEQTRYNGYGGLSQEQFAKLEDRLRNVEIRDGIDDLEALALAQMELVKRQRHNRFDTSTAEISSSKAPGQVIVRFYGFPTTPALPVRSSLLVAVNDNGRTELLEEAP